MSTAVPASATAGDPPLSGPLPPVRSREELAQAIVVFVNELLPRLDPRRAGRPRVETETHLFEGGVLDSLNILHLIGAVEALTGRGIPSRLVVMKHFRSAAAIAETFWQDDGDAA